MNKIKLKKILIAFIAGLTINPFSMFKAYALSGPTAYVGDTYGNNIVIEGKAFPNTAVTIKLIRIKDNNIRYTNEIKSNAKGKFKFAINTEADKYKALVSSMGLTVERQLTVNNLTKGTVSVRIEGENSTILNQRKVNVEAGHTTYNIAIKKALKQNNISYIEKDNKVKIVNEGESSSDWVWKVKGRKEQVVPTGLVKENDEIILVPRDLQDAKITRLKVSPMGKDIINAGKIEITKGSSFIAKLEQLDIDMFGDIKSTAVAGQVIKFNNISKTTNENGEVVFVSNNEGKFNITCEPTKNQIHERFIRPIEVFVVVKPKPSYSGSSGGGGTSSTVIDNEKIQENNKEKSFLRLSGSNRYETSKSIGNEYIKNSQINGVILALGENFPDALSGSVLCNKYKMPIMLAGSTVKDSSAAISYIEKNLTKDKQIYILGGTGGIGEDVETYIKSKGYNKVQRIGGKDRFETNGKIVDKLNVKEGTPIIIASGENFPDALSISAVAGAKGYPVLLVNKNNISKVIQDRLIKIKPNKIFIIGGIGSVSRENVNMVKNITKLYGKNIIRIWGNDRYDTSLKIAKHFKLQGDTVTFASGQNFPDALSGSGLSSLKNAPLILINNNDVSKQRAYVVNSNYDKEIFYGGSGAIKNEILQLLLQPSKLIKK